MSGKRLGTRLTFSRSPGEAVVRCHWYLLPPGTPVRDGTMKLGRAQKEEWDSRSPHVAGPARGTLVHTSLPPVAPVQVGEDPGRAGQVPGPSVIRPGGVSFFHRCTGLVVRTSRCYRMLSKDGPHRLSPASAASDGGKADKRIRTKQGGDPHSLPFLGSLTRDGGINVMYTNQNCY